VADDSIITDNGVSEHLEIGQTVIINISLPISRPRKVSADCQANFCVATSTALDVVFVASDDAVMFWQQTSEFFPDISLTSAVDHRTQNDCYFLTAPNPHQIHDFLEFSKVEEFKKPFGSLELTKLALKTVEDARSKFDVKLKLESRHLLVAGSRDSVNEATAWLLKTYENELQRLRSNSAALKKANESSRQAAPHIKLEATFEIKQEISCEKAPQPNLESSSGDQNSFKKTRKTEHCSASYPDNTAVAESNIATEMANNIENCNPHPKRETKHPEKAESRRIVASQEIICPQFPGSLCQKAFQGFCKSKRCKKAHPIVIAKGLLKIRHCEYFLRFPDIKHPDCELHLEKKPHLKFRALNKIYRKMVLKVHTKSKCKCVPTPPTFAPVPPTYAPIAPTYTPITPTYAPIPPTYVPIPPIYSPMSLDQNSLILASRRVVLEDGELSSNGSDTQMSKQQPRKPRSSPRGSAKARDKFCALTFSKVCSAPSRRSALKPTRFLH